MREMASNVLTFPKYVYDSYHWAMSFGDPRTRGWFLVDSPLPNLAMTALYLVMVRVGPKLMRNRPPFHIQAFIIVYNLCMVAANAYMFVEIARAAISLDYSLICQPITFHYEEEELRLATALWVYYISKLVEFLDTVFFLLKKKDEHLSFLHVYHHASVFTLWWTVVKFAPGGHTYGPALFNTAVHVIMYTYYTLAALGPRVQKYLWWKKYITVIQLVQFTILGLLSANVILSDCDFPKWMVVLCMLQMALFFILFFKFFIRSYMLKLTPGLDDDKEHYN